MPPTVMSGNKRGGVGFKIKKSLGVLVHEKGTPRKSSPATTTTTVNQESLLREQMFISRRYPHKRKLFKLVMITCGIKERCRQNEEYKETSTWGRVGQKVFSLHPMTTILPPTHTDQANCMFVGLKFFYVSRQDSYKSFRNRPA